jgi:DNA-directed RNA polymerase specialized sigma24 family protein
VWADHDDSVEKPLCAPPGSFANWYRATYKQVLTYLAGMTLDADAAMDLTVEAFVQAFETRHRMWRRSPPERMGWLWVLVREGLMRYQPGASVEMPATHRLGFALEPVEDADRLLVGQLWRDAVEHNDLYDAFVHLTPLQQSTLRMHVIFELDEDIIAEHLGSDVGAVRVAVSEALWDLADQGSLKPIVSGG